MVTADDTGHESKFQTDNNKPLITIHLTPHRRFESVSGVDCNSLTGVRHKIMAFYTYPKCYIQFSSLHRYSDHLTILNSYRFG